jgi:hypothetical protein
VEPLRAEGQRFRRRGGPPLVRAERGRVAVQHDRISIGAQPTRLFAKSDGEAAAEVESSYAFGRGLRWWDQHYQEIADYEVQYQRLDQIMRWSAALEWLGENRGKLPPHSEVGIRSDLRFADWYLRNNALRERVPIHYVTPPSAGQESVLTVPSEKYESCGITTINGGVSLGDLGARKAKAGRTFQADLPGSVRRAGLYDEKSTFDPATGTGSMRQVSIDEAGAESSFRSHTISRDGNGTVRVEVSASPRRIVQLGGLKVWRGRGRDPLGHRRAARRPRAGLPAGSLPGQGLWRAHRGEAGRAGHAPVAHRPRRRDELLLSLTVVLIGALGLAFSASYMELYARNRRRAELIRKNLDNRFFATGDPTIAELLNASDNDHEHSRIYRWSRRLTGSTQLFWLLVQGIIIAAGIVLASMAA